MVRVGLPRRIPWLAQRGQAAGSPIGRRCRDRPARCARVELKTTRTLQPRIAPAEVEIDEAWSANLKRGTLRGRTLTLSPPTLYLTPDQAQQPAMTDANGRCRYHCGPGSRAIGTQPHYEVSVSCARHY